VAHLKIQALAEELRQQQLKFRNETHDAAPAVHSG
jgi:hypothetical protein